MSNTFFQGGRKIFQGEEYPLTPLVTGLASQERILGWLAYPLLRFDENVLSRWAEYHDIIRGLFQPSLGRPPILSPPLVITMQYSIYC